MHIQRIADLAVLEWAGRDRAGLARGADSSFRARTGRARIARQRGVVLGAGVLASQSEFGIGCRWRLTIGTLLVAILAVLAEHAWLYRDFRGQWQERGTTLGRGDVSSGDAAVAG